MDILISTIIIKDPKGAGEHESEYYLSIQFNETKREQLTR